MAASRELASWESRLEASRLTAATPAPVGFGSHSDNHSKRNLCRGHHRGSAPNVMSSKQQSQVHNAGHKIKWGLGLGSGKFGHVSLALKPNPSRLESHALPQCWRTDSAALRILSIACCDKSEATQSFLRNNCRRLSRGSSAGVRLASMSPGARREGGGALRSKRVCALLRAALASVFW